MVPRPNHALPPARSQPLPRRSVGDHFSPAVWRGLFQQARIQQDWMRSAAIAYGLVGCLMVGFLALLAAASLSDGVETRVLYGLTRWFPDGATHIQQLIDQTTLEWRSHHRWLLLMVSGGFSIGLWLKVIGSIQHTLRSGGLEAAPVPSLRQRLVTVLAALVTAVLLLLAVAAAFATLPTELTTSTETVTLLSFGKQLLVKGLRWSLALSTMSLVFGILYRCSQKSLTAVQPILPGTILAMAVWALSAVLLKAQLATLASHHWLYSLISTIALGLLGVYLTSIGLLLGGRYNAVMNRYFPQARSRRANSTAPSPPPSFESFTIQRRYDRSDRF